LVQVVGPLERLNHDLGAQALAVLMRRLGHTDFLKRRFSFGCHATDTPLDQDGQGFP